MTEQEKHMQELKAYEIKLENAVALLRECLSDLPYYTPLCDDVCNFLDAYDEKDGKK